MIKLVLSLIKAIDYAHSFIDIIDAPIQQVINYCQRINSHSLNINLLTKSIIKRKNILKRYRAKNRQPKQFYPMDEYPLIVNTQNGESET